MRLATAESHYRLRSRDRFNVRGRVRPSEIAPRKRGVIPMTDEIDPVLVIEVRANHGRWVADCPFCNGAQLASSTDPRFLCADCGNVNIEGKWIRVVWPSNAEAIEAVLVARPKEHRNWRPSEFVSALRAENVEHEIAEEA